MFINAATDFVNIWTGGLSASRLDFWNSPRISSSIHRHRVREDVERKLDDTCMCSLNKVPINVKDSQSINSL